MSTTTEARSETQVHDISIDAGPEAIWAAITSSEFTQRYGYGGNVEYDLRPGGAYRAVATEEMQAFGMPAVMVEGEVLEVQEPRRLVQTWRALFDADIAAEAPTTLTWEIQPGPSGSTGLTVTHETPGAPRTAAMVSGSIPEAGGGWPGILRDLKTLLETGAASHETVPGRPDPHEA